MKKVLITGASGLLGRALMLAFTEATQFEPQGTALSRAHDTVSRLDLRNESGIRALIEDSEPEFIIHSAALRQPDICENDMDLTHRINVEATGVIADCARRSGCWLIYISTDYVFDGTAPPYHPDAETNPLNYYGKSKRDGELAVKSLLNDYCILRVPILYGPIETLEESAVTAIAKAMLDADGKQLTLDNLAIRYPTLTTDLGALCTALIGHKLENTDFGGTVHWSGNEAMTKYQMALEMSSVLGIDPATLIPDDNPRQTAPRPHNAHLDCSVLSQLNLIHNTPFADGIRSILAPWH